MNVMLCTSVYCYNPESIELEFEIDCSQLRYFVCVLLDYFITIALFSITI